MITKNDNFGAPQNSVTFMVADDGNKPDGNKPILYSKTNTKYGVDVDIYPLGHNRFQYVINKNEPNYCVLDGASLKVAHGLVRLNLDNSVTFPSSNGLNLDVPFGSKGINGIKKGWKLIRLNLPKFAKICLKRKKAMAKHNSFYRKNSMPYF